MLAEFICSLQFIIINVLQLQLNYVFLLFFQYNNVDFLTITPEKASTELNKPCAFVRMQAQYNPASK